MEVKYGINLSKNLCRKPEFIQLKDAFGNQGKAFEVAMSQAIEEFDDWTNTKYIACFSEHMSEENQYGRLSMWCGYGSDSSVAFALKHDSFITENNFFNIYTSSY